MRKYLSFAILLLLLVGFPAASYYYMRDGFQYRVRAIEAQGDYGRMPPLNNLSPLRGELPGNLRGSMVVVGWLDEKSPATAATYGRTLDSLYLQFNNSPNLYFTTLTNGDSTFANQWAEQYGIPDDPMLSMLSVNTEAELKSSGIAFKLPAVAGSEPVVALVDSSMTIRKYYDLNNREETIGLVQLISLIIPLPAKADIYLKPQKEF